MYKMYLGCLFMLGGYYFRKPIVYNGIYTWVIMEEYFNSFKNKYFRNKLNVYEYKDKSIIEVFDKNFMYRKCFLKSKENQEYPENQENHEYNDIVFNTNLFISVLLFPDKREEENIDLTKELNLFVNKNTKLNINYDFTTILNEFLNLNLNIDREQIYWNIMDNSMNEYNGNNILLDIDNNCKINNFTLKDTF